MTVSYHTDLCGHRADPDPLDKITQVVAVYPDPSPRFRNQWRHAARHEECGAHRRICMDEPGGLWSDDWRHLTPA